MICPSSRDQAMNLVEDHTAADDVTSGVLCPVCRWPVRGHELECYICQWRLVGEWIAGSASAQDHQDLADRLAAARQLHDLRAAARALPLEFENRSSRRSLLTGFVRGGLPSADKLDQVVAELHAEDQANQASAAGTGFAIA